MQKLPVKLNEIISAVKQITEEADEPVLVLLAGEPDVGKKEIVARLTEGASDASAVHSVVLAGGATAAAHATTVARADVVLVVVDATRRFGDPTVSFVNSLRTVRKPFIVVVNKVDAMAESESLIERLRSLLDVDANRTVFICATRDVGIKDDLAKRIVDVVHHKLVALGSRLPVLRKAASRREIMRTAWQNALIGGVTILPGTDMPILTANQAKMVLRVAAIYGQELTPDRAKELLVVVGGGFTLRAIARQLLDFVPGPGWIVKGSIAYSGTVAIGQAARKYFEVGPLV